MEKKIYAFETWPGGISGFYEGNEALCFIDEHESSNTFSRLHVFNDVHAALKSYNEYVGCVDVYVEAE